VRAGELAKKYVRFNFYITEFSVAEELHSIFWQSSSSRPLGLLLLSRVNRQANKLGMDGHTVVK